MSWAARRRFIIALIVGAVTLAFLAILSIATFYEAPTCTDSVQNQDEAGIDCGGACQYLCTEQVHPPTVLFTKAIQNNEGRVDVVAKVENKNADAAAKDVPYNVTLYGDDHVFIQELHGRIDLPPGTSVPIFIPSVSLGRQAVVRAFLEIDPSSPRWFTMSLDSHIVPVVSNTRQGGTTSAPRIEATLKNPSVTVLSNVKVVVLVRNDKGDVIAASSTVVPSIPAQGQAIATFTWGEAFQSIPASIEVTPIIPLPAQAGLPNR